MNRISVVIPNYNSGDLLRRCLAALRASEPTTAPLHEVIVVDDKSTDGSAAVAAEFGARLESLNANLGPARARNRGAELATGEIIWFIDADTEPAPNACVVLRNFLQEHPDFVAAIGSYDDSPSDPHACSQFKNLFHHFVHQTADEYVSSFWTGCGVIRTDEFRAIGGFDAVYWSKPSVEDIHLGYLLGRRGHRIHMVKALQVKHNKRWTLVNLVRTDVFQRAVPWTAMLLHNRGKGNTELNLGWEARASVVAVYLALLCVIIGLLRPVFWIPVPVLLVVPILLNRALVKFFRQRGGWLFLLKAIPLLWLYFLYSGAGFLLGIRLYLHESRTGQHAFTNE